MSNDDTGGLGAGAANPFESAAAAENAQGKLETILQGLGHASTVQRHAQNVIGSLQRGDIFAAAGSAIHAGVSLQKFTEATGIGQEQLSWVYEQLGSIFGMNVSNAQGDVASVQPDVSANTAHEGHAAQLVENLTSGRVKNSADHMNNILGAFGQEGEQKAVEMAVSGVLDVAGPETAGLSELAQPFVGQIASGLIKAKDHVVGMFQEALETRPLGQANLLEPVVTDGPGVKPLETPDVVRESQPAVHM